jgi:hypothetical protein
MKRIDVSAIHEMDRSISRHRAFARVVFGRTMMKFGEESGGMNFEGIQRVKPGTFMWTS